MSTLQIIETAYRATLEEQDDPVLWITHAMRNAGAELAVLLCGSAVNYALALKEAPVGLEIGAWRQAQPPRLSDDVLGLTTKGIEVYAVSEDLAERGIAASSLLPGIGLVPRAQLPALFAKFARIWRW